MNIQFNTLFTLNLKHNYFANGLCPDFDIVPTAECRANLQRFGLGAKQIAGVMVVYFQQSPVTGMPRLRLDDWTRFSFVLKLKQTEFYNYTTLPTATKPFLFSNLDKNGLEKPANTEGGIVLSKNSTPNDDDLTEFNNNLFSVDFPIGTTQVKLSTFRPQTGFEAAKTIDVNPLTTSKDVSIAAFQSGWVQVENNGGAPTKYIYCEPSVARARPFGIIEIWKSATTDYTQQQSFVLNWERKTDFWRYFIIKKQTETDLFIQVNNIKATTVYPSNVVFDFIGEADRTNSEKQFINNYKDAVAIDLFRSSVALPQYEQPLGKIQLSDTEGRLDLPLPQPTFRSADTNIIIKIQKS